MNRLLVLVAILGTASACGGPGGPTAPDASCVAVVNVHGVFFSPASVAPADPATVSPTPWLTVSRNTGCLDQGEPDPGLAHGESNFLPAGTGLHRITDVPPEEGLAYWAPLLGEWRILGPRG